MKWKKLGKIFDPSKHKLANNCVFYAQSPQFLELESFVRIYFSTRETDNKGKFISHIAFVEMTKDFSKILKVSEHKVITVGALGCYDEHGIFPMNILKDEDKVFGFIGGWSRRISVSVETSIGLAVSEDNGYSFKRIGDGPILSSSMNEPFLVGDPFALKLGNIYHLWYIYGVRWINNPETNDKERVYKIGHATSIDAINWNRTNRQIIKDKLNENECQALPSVVIYEEKFHMLFCYRQAIGFRENRENSYRLGYAYSSDGINWIRDDENVGIDVSENDWDSDMLCYPHVFKYDDKVYLLYNGNEFGKYGFGIAVLEN